MSPTKKILLISASAGNGHIRAAQAIEAYAQTKFPQIEVKHIDLYEVACSLVHWICSKGYIILINHLKFLWKLLYKMSDCSGNSIFGYFQHWGERFFFRRILEEVKTFQPDDIVCTHFTPANILVTARNKGKISAKIWVQVTDFHLHLQWLCHGVDGYFVGCEKVKDDLVKQGIPEEQIVVNGIPIMPAFAKTYSRTECAQELGVDPEQKTYLLMSGGCAGHGILKDTQKILEIEGFQLFVIAGRNEAVFQELCKIHPRYPQRLFPIAFTNHIERVMACSDLLISKPGGLSSSEAMAMGLPMIAYAPIPGHEEANAEMLKASQAAIRADNLTELVGAIQTLTKNPSQLESMHENIKKIAHPLAAQILLETILKYEK